jgi:hypothetical protein
VGRDVRQDEMPFLFLVAAAVTSLLALLLIGSLLAGLGLCFVPRFRRVAPFIMFIPTFTALGAGGGAWGLAYAAHSYAPMSVLPFWGWCVGLLLGAGLGLLLGAGLALLTRKAFPAPPNPPLQATAAPLHC